MATPLIVDTTDMVEVTDIQKLEDWPVSKTIVAGMVEAYRQGKSLGTPIVHRVWHGDGSCHYEVIDGYHRVNAMKRVEMERFQATVRECDSRTAELDRIAASLGKPDEVLQGRALSAIKTRFIVDIAGIIAPHELYTFELIEADPGMRVIRRKGDMPESPLLALLVLSNHILAKLALLRSHASADVQEWEGQLTGWLREFSAQFGQESDWLMQILGVELIADERKGMWDLIRHVPDEQVQMMLISRVQTETDVQWGRLTVAELKLALEYLGLGSWADSDVISWQRHRSRREVLSLLPAHTLRQMANTARQKNKTVPHLNLPRPNQATVEKQAETVYQKPSDAVFATVSPKWTEPREKVDAVKIDTVKVDTVPLFHSAYLDFMKVAQVSEYQIDWKQKQIHADLLALKAWLDAKLAD